MANETPSSKTVDFALIEQLGINEVASALGLSVGAVRRWRSRGVPKDRQAMVLALAEAEQEGLPSSSADLDGCATAVDQVGHDLRSASDAADEEPPEPAPTQPPAWDDDDDGPDPAPAALASAPTGQADEKRHEAVAKPATVMQGQRPRSPFRQSGRGVRPNVVPPKAVQETRKSVRLNRKTVLAVTGGLAVAIVVGLAHGMSQVGGSTIRAQAEVDDEPVYQPLGTAFLPKYEYTNLPQQAALTVETEPPKEPAAPPEAEPAPTVVTQTRVVAPARDRNAEEEEAALQSPLFPAGASASRAVTPVLAAGASSSQETLAALDRLRTRLPTPQDLSPQGQPSVANQQDSFLSAQLDEAIYLKNGLQKPLSDFEVK
ncbi:MAG: hypothetical protein OEU92_32310, partial [Alphaproteobacteria bacterium]|nr:hypothetical protein [Alphaproteobacteria bacterium]